MLVAEMRMEGGFEGHNTFTLTETNGRTRVEQVGEFRYLNGMSALMEPLVTPQAKKKLDSDLARLKQLAEAAPVEAAAPDSATAPASP